ncbi:MAG TPA: hypothetical protein VH281_04850 [Gaiellaceae bacterium]|jgi:hypothetical protein
MEIVAAVLATLLAVACVTFVARPFLAEPEALDDRLASLTPAEEARLQLLERRDRALAALKELEFDHRTGKIGDADYEALVGALRGEAAETLQALEPVRGPAVERPEKVDAPA